MWEITSLLLSSSDLCNYIPAVPSWWEICRFWWSVSSCLQKSNRICWWRVKRVLTRQYFFSLFDLTTPPLRQWNEWQFQSNWITLEWLVKLPYISDIWIFAPKWTEFWCYILRENSNNFALLKMRFFERILFRAPKISKNSDFQG